MPIAAPSNLLQKAGGYLKFAREFGGIYPDVIIEEAHYDSVQMTEHPVERGAAITDHAYVRPKDVIIWCGWSASVSGANFLIANPLAEFEPFVTGPSYLQQKYQELIDMMEARQPIEILTGKRYYPNALITSIAVTTDRKSEYALLATVRFRELLYVSTTVREMPSSNQDDPSRTSSVEEYGAKQPIPAPGGLLVGGT